MSTQAVEDLVTWERPAKMVGLKERAFWEAVHTKGIPRYVINPRVIRFRLSEVEEWLKNRRTGE